MSAPAVSMSARHEARAVEEQRDASTREEEEEEQEEEQGQGEDKDGVDEEEDVIHDRTKYRFVKRTPLRAVTQRHDMYVTTSRSFRALIKRAHSILFETPSSSSSSAAPFVDIHALGAAIPLAIDLALQLTGKLEIGASSLPHLRPGVRRRTPPSTASQAPVSLPVNPPSSFSPYPVGTFQSTMRTSTVSLIDDYEPLLPELPPLSRTRRNSAIHVRISLSAPAKNKLYPSAAHLAAVAASQPATLNSSSSSYRDNSGNFDRGRGASSRGGGNQSGAGNRGRGSFNDRGGGGRGGGARGGGRGASRGTGHQRPRDESSSSSHRGGDKRQKL